MRHWGKVVVGLSLMGLLSGCWSNRPVERRNLALMLGVGPAPHHQIRLIFQIPTRSGLTGLTKGSGASQEASFYLIEGVGATMTDAFAQAQAKTTRDLYLGQVEVVAFSTRLPPTAFEQARNMFSRLGSLDKTAYAVATPSVRRLLALQPRSGELPGIILASNFGCLSCNVEHLERTVWDMETAHYNRGINLWLPLLSAGPHGFEINQMAVYAQDRPVLILTPPETQALGYVMGLTHKGTLTFRWGPHWVALRALDARPHFAMAWKDGRPAIAITLDVTGSLAEYLRGELTPPVLKAVETAAEKDLARRVTAVLARLQQAHVDPVGFGQSWVWFHPTRFARLGSWRQAFAHATISVQVHLRLNDIGDLT
ncbi:MAG: hypothetical protein K6U14_09385 [Firmicutes bacterium]|nr:hypothetical protein [Alicyclobacillaceae bacterium]MCL6497824.1 hypothetical protein [Bacillota bacterium]